MAFPPHARKRLPAAGWLVLAVLAAGGCGTLITPEPDEDPQFAQSLGGLRAQARVDTNPSGAAVSVNGRVIGFAPVSVALEVNRDGDLIDDIAISAEFPGGETAAQSFSRGTKPPSAVTIRAGGASSYLGR